MSTPGGAIQDFLPLFDETVDTVYQRLADWANEGLDDTDPRWVDTREGSIFWICSRPAAQEDARLYDLLGVDVPASAMVLWTWGEYLDAIAAVQGIERALATRAVGTVTFTGDEGTLIAASQGVSTVPAGGSGIVPVAFAVTASGTIPGGGSIDLPVQAALAGSAGNVAADAITQLLSDVPGVASLTNADPTFGGSDVQTDASLLAELLAVYGGDPSTNILWYVLTVKAWLQANDPEHCPRGGQVTVGADWDGPGTVLVTATTDGGGALAGGIVDALQAYLYPTPGAAVGVAPVSAEVTVQTASTVTANIAATIIFRDGYSLDGSDGTIELDVQITAAVTTYVNGLAVGEDVTLAGIIAAILTVRGVEDVTLSTVEINTAATNLTISSTHVARIGTTTWS